MLRQSKSSSAFLLSHTKEIETINFLELVEIAYYSVFPQTRKETAEAFWVLSQKDANRAFLIENHIVDALFALLHHIDFRKEVECVEYILLSMNEVMEKYIDSYGVAILVTECPLLWKTIITGQRLVQLVGIELLLKICLVNDDFTLAIVHSVELDPMPTLVEFLKSKDKQLMYNLLQLLVTIETTVQVKCSTSSIRWNSQMIHKAIEIPLLEGKGSLIGEGKPLVGIDEKILKEYYDWVYALTLHRPNCHTFAEANVIHIFTKHIRQLHYVQQKWKEMNNSIISSNRNINRKPKDNETNIIDKFIFLALRIMNSLIETLTVKEMDLCVDKEIIELIVSLIEMNLKSNKDKSKHKLQPQIRGTKDQQNTLMENAAPTGCRERSRTSYQLENIYQLCFQCLIRLTKNAKAAQMISSTNLWLLYSTCEWYKTPSYTKHIYLLIGVLSEVYRTRLSPSLSPYLSKADGYIHETDAFLTFLFVLVDEYCAHCSSGLSSRPLSAHSSRLSYSLSSVSSLPSRPSSALPSPDSSLVQPSLVTTTKTAPLRSVFHAVTNVSTTAFFHRIYHANLPNLLLLFTEATKLKDVNLIIREDAICFIANITERKDAFVSFEERHLYFSYIAECLLPRYAQSQIHQWAIYACFSVIKQIRDNDSTSDRKEKKRDRETKIKEAFVQYGLLRLLLKNVKHNIDHRNGYVLYTIKVLKFDAAALRIQGRVRRYLFMRSMNEIKRARKCSVNTAWNNKQMRQYGNTKKAIMERYKASN